MTDARLRYLSAQLHALGPRATFELLREIDAGAPLQPRLEAYAALSDYRDFIADNGGDRLPGLRIIRGGG